MRESIDILGGTMARTESYTVFNTLDGNQHLHERSVQKIFERAIVKGMN